MSVYLVACIKIKDEERYMTEYVPQVRDQAAKYGGRALAASPSQIVKEGNWDESRTVIYEFPDMASIESFYHSEAYAPLKQLRQEIADSTVVFVPGI